MASHNFIVTHANYVGDPNAIVHSFGKNNLGNAGRVDHSTTGMSAGTYAADIAAWKDLINASDLCSDYTLINASDDVVSKNALSIDETNPYSPIPGRHSANSNTAAQAITDRSAGYHVETPGGSRISPGAGSRHLYKMY